jgi:hypothetical protein
MGRIKIWKEGIESKEGDILLRLLPKEDCDCSECQKDKEETVALCAVDRSGKRVIAGNLLFFNDIFGIKFAGGVNKSIGFSLDEDGTLAIEDPLNEIKKDEKKDEKKYGKEESQISKFLKNIAIKTVNEEIKKLEEKKKELESL